jgi:hypothetical protein
MLSCLKLQTKNFREIKAGFEKAGGYWMELNPARYKTYDGSHLTIESARQLSDEMGGFIKDRIE